MRTLDYARHPSPPRSCSPDEKHQVLPTTEITDALPLHTPPDPMMPSPGDMYPYDIYGDPTLYHLPEQQQQQPSYYQSDPYAPAYHSEYQMSSSPGRPYPEAAMHTRTRTRSGRSPACPPSPEPSPAVSQRLQTPKKKPPRKRAGKGKAGGTILNQPLSILTRDYVLPIRDMEAWANRSAETRRLETEKKNGYISRPMNSFMLYRSAYAERVKQFCKENNHQVVSQVTGASWPLEPESVRKEYERLAILERDNHAAAFPDYKFAPNKTGKKRGRGEGEAEGNSNGNLNDDDSDGEWGGSSRTKRSRTTAKSSRYGDSRSNTGTPLDDGYYSTSYSPVSIPVPFNLSSSSSYQQHYSRGVTAQSFPQIRHPDAVAHQQQTHQHEQQYQQQYQHHPQHRFSNYAPANVEELPYGRHAHLVMPKQEPSAVVGMPGRDNSVLVGTKSELGEIGMVDPRLDVGVRYDAYGLAYAVPSSEPYHPAQPPRTDGWGQPTATHPGAAFDFEFDNLRYP